jgi:hypothetical protein
MNKFRFLTFKQQFPKISVSLYNGYLAEGQWLEEQMNVMKLCVFRVGT